MEEKGRGEGCVLSRAHRAWTFTLEYPAARLARSPILLKKKNLLIKHQWFGTRVATVQQNFPRDYFYLLTSQGWSCTSTTKPWNAPSLITSRARALPGSRAWGFV